MIGPLLFAAMIAERGRERGSLEPRRIVENLSRKVDNACNITDFVLLR